MATFKGDPVRVSVPATDIAAKFDDLTVLDKHLENIPAEHRAKVGDISFTTDSIIVNNPAVGQMTFKLVRHDSQGIVFVADGMLPLTLDVALDSADDNASETMVTTAIDMEIPAFMRPFIGGKMQQVANTFGTLIAQLAGNKGAQQND